MLLVSWNVNGLRAVAKRNFIDWVSSANPDILCLQEIKVSQLDLAPELSNLKGYRSYFNFAAKKGYAGVAVYTKLKPLKIVSTVLDHEQCNQEGRTLLLEFEKFSLLNLYMPHGSRDKSKLPYKLELYKQFLNLLKEYTVKPLILAGDFNIAHQDIDLARPKQNRNNIMFTAEERKQLDSLLAQKYTDSYRLFHREGGGYTWWPYMANARARNIGWRIDYIFVPNSLRSRTKEANILSSVFGSDHCPVTITMNNFAS